MKSCTRIVSWRTHCLFSTAFRITVLKDLSCLISVTELPLLSGTFLLHLSELLSSSLSSSDELRSTQAKEWENRVMTRKSILQENCFIAHHIADHQEHILGGLQGMAVKSTQEKAFPPTAFSLVCIL